MLLKWLLWLSIVGSNAFSAFTLAQSYPSKPIRLIVPFTPGGGADATARVIAPVLSERLGQTIVVDNRGGAGGTIGAAQAARATPDGYTLLLGTTNLAAAPALLGKLSFDPIRDFAAVSLLARTPGVLAVHPSLPVKSVKQLIALARAKPGLINYAGGVGSTLHLDAELFKTMAKVDIVQVPYNGTGPALVGVLAGEASVVIAPTISVLPHARTGRLHALAVTSLQRSAAAPELPTVSETLPGYETGQWYGILVPAGTPGAIISRLNSECVQIVQSPDFSSRMTREGSIPLGTSAQEFAGYFNAEIAKWNRVIKFSGASPN
jgi:tripartite-type tricarboxylate transporter receptor subunit TctC